MEDTYFCSFCKGRFDHLENLQKHVQQIHTLPSKSKDKTCPLCGLWCVKQTYLDHLKHIHRQNEEGKAFLLKCFNDFFVWKNELEKRNYCKYILQGQPKVIQPSKDKIHVYRCDSSTPSTKGKNSAFGLKEPCPATISVLENAKNHSIKVEYWNTHIGHSIPVHGDELDAAIGYLQTTEIVVDEQSYQSDEQESESAIYFLNESNDGSFSESFVKDTHRKSPPALFQNNGDSFSNYTSKSMSRKFSFKKDPSKKSLSFSGSLASVACMKASVKKNVSTPTTLVASSAIKTSVSQSTPTTSVTSIENENSDSQPSETLSLNSKMNKKDKEIITKNSKVKIPRNTKTDFKTIAKSKNVKDKEEKDSKSQTLAHAVASTPSSPSQVKVGAPALSESVLSNLKLMVNDGKLNGQFILLNSLQSPNGQQSLILCPVDGNVSSGVQSITTAAQTKGQVAKPSDKTPTSSSVQNVLTLAENVPCPAGVERITLPPGPSILKNSEKEDKSTELKTSSLTETPKARKRATRKKTLPIGQKLSLAGAASSISNASNQAGTGIKGIITVNSPNTTTSSNSSPVVGNKVLANSVTGVSYIQINNTLFPINTPARPNLNSNGMFPSPMSLSQNLHHSPKSVISFSALAQPPTTLIMNTTKSSVVGTAPIDAKSQLPTNNLPIFMISQVGNNPASMPISPLAQNSGKTAASSPMLKSVQTLNSSFLPQIGKIRSSIQTNAQFIPSPRLLAVPQPFIRQAVPGSFVLRGTGPITSTPKVKRVRLPTSSNSPKSNASPTLKSTNLNSVVFNTAPISSTPAITIPSAPIAHPQKPGSFIFESSGDLYVLEPIEDAKNLKSQLPIKKDKDTRNTSKAQSDSENVVIDNDNVENNPVNSENDLTASPSIEARVELKSKRPKICPTFSDGKKIAALPQKRRMKEDDSEILKKIKYYNLEMKYLTSQAECKRLKLELARVHMKNKASSEYEPMILDEDFLKEKTDVIQNMTSEIPDNLVENSDEVVITELTNSLLQQVEKIQTDKNNTIENDLHSILKDQSTENGLKQNTKESVELSLEEKMSQKVVELEKKEQPMDYEECEIKTDIILNPLEVGISVGGGETVVSCDKDKDANNQAIEAKAKSLPEIEEKSLNTFEIENNSTVNNELLDASVNNDEIMDNSLTVNQSKMDNSLLENESKLDNSLTENESTVDNSLTESESKVDNSLTDSESKVGETIVTSIGSSETIDNIESNRDLVNKCIDSFENQPEIFSSDVNDDQKILTILDDRIQTIKEESAKLQELLKEQVMEIDNFESDQSINTKEDVQFFDSGTKFNEEQEVLVNSCEDQAVEETLKDLETKYGEESSDIYTMIRTSVLRSLYADMKELCQENKKLFEELQGLKSHGESYEGVAEETQNEQL